MAKSNIQETGYLKLVYQNIALANIGDASGLQPSATVGNLYATLYTTDPTDADTGTEANYTGYTRIAVIRSAAGWTVTGATISNAAIITFPTSTGVVNTITHVAIKTAASGGNIVHHGKLVSPLVVTSGDIPKFEIGNFAVTEH